MDHEAQNAAARLEQERAALRQDEAALAESENRNDAPGMADSMRLIEARNRVISKLEAEAELAARAATEAKAEPLAASYVKYLKASRKRIETLQAERERLIAPFLDNISQEVNERTSAAGTRLGLELLRARFPNINIPDVKEVVVPFVDSAGPIVRAEDKLLRLRRRDVFFHPATRAGDTAEQTAWEELAEIHEIITKWRQFVPAECLEVLEPLPPLGQRPKDAPPPSMVEQTQRALKGSGVRVGSIG